MLDVIFTRGLPLDRITTTDVWATDTISANLPPMEEFKARMDERIWHLYRMDVEHLCARNKDGSKRTYEQMFYHVPVRKSGGGTSMVQSLGSQICGTHGVKLDSNGMPSHRVQGTITGFPPNTGYNYCQKLKLVQTPYQGISTLQRKTHMVPETQAPGGNTPSPMSAPRGAKKEISWSTSELLRTSLPGLVS
jgi:hypothetical protein